MPRAWCSRSRGLAECQRMEVDRSHRTVQNEEVFSLGHPMRRLQVLKGVGWVPRGKAASGDFGDKEGKMLGSDLYFQRVGLFL